MCCSTIKKAEPRLSMFSRPQMVDLKVFVLFSKQESGSRAQGIKKALTVAVTSCYAIILEVGEFQS